MAFATLTACGGCREEPLRPSPADFGSPALNIESHLQAGALAALSANSQQDFAAYAARELALYGYLGLPGQPDVPRPLLDPNTREVWALLPEGAAANEAAVWLVAPGDSPRAVAVALEAARQIRARAIVGLGARRLAGVIVVQDRGLEGVLDRFEPGGRLEVGDGAAPIFVWLRADRQDGPAPLQVRGPTYLLAMLGAPPAGWTHEFLRADEPPATAATAIEIQLPAPQLHGSELAAWLAAAL